MPGGWRTIAAHGHRADRPLDRRAFEPDRRAHAVARRAGRGAHPARRGLRRADARLHHAHLRPRSPTGEGSRGRDRGRQTPGDPARDPVRAQGHLRHAGDPHLGPLPRLHRPDSRRGRHRDEAALRRRRRAARQARHPRDGARGSLVRSAVAAGAQSVEPGPLHGWLLVGLGIGVLRHHWEQDIPATEDVRNAMDAALDVLRRLGATLEECSVRPLAAYFDVKIVIAESEIFSVHQANLQTRAKDFGADFRSRVLPSVLFTAHDYVQATREHRRMMVEMEPLYGRFDAFVTAGMGEAARLSDYRSVSFWQKPSVLTAWNVTGQPVLALPNGFGRNGLPLGMQIVGRPFGETTILRVGHAYERATAWHTRRPQLARGAAAPDVVPPPVLSSGADQVDAETRDLCVKSARRAGVQLDDLMLAQLLEGAPYALAMVERLRRFRLG